MDKEEKQQFERKLKSVLFTQLNFILQFFLSFLKCEKKINIKWKLFLKCSTRNKSVYKKSTLVMPYNVKRFKFFFYINGVIFKFDCWVISFQMTQAS
jgi:hypothetical protein